MKLTEEQIKSIAESLRNGYLSEMKEVLNGENQYSGPDDERYSEDFGVWLDSPHPEVPEYEKWYNSNDNSDDEYLNDYRSIGKAALPSYDEFVSFITSKEDDKDADNSEESEDKPHEEDILPDGEESELEKKMTPEEFKIASNITGRSTGDFEPETPEDVQFMLEANKNGLKVSDERLKNVQNNSINSIANTLKNYRW